MSPPSFRRPVHAWRARRLENSRCNVLVLATGNDRIAHRVHSRKRPCDSGALPATVLVASHTRSHRSRTPLLHRHHRLICFSPSFHPSIFASQATVGRIVLLSSLLRLARAKAAAAAAAAASCFSFSAPILCVTRKASIDVRKCGSPRARYRETPSIKSRNIQTGQNLALALAKRRKQNAHLMREKSMDSNQR